jgi:hypothetical protein
MFGQRALGEIVSLQQLAAPDGVLDIITPLSDGPHGGR